MVCKELCSQVRCLLRDCFYSYCQLGRRITIQASFGTARQNSASRAILGIIFICENFKMIQSHSIFDYDVQLFVCLLFVCMKREKFEKETVKNWDKFYLRNEVYLKNFHIDSCLKYSL